MVMSIGFLNALKQAYPAAAISVIAKEGVHQILEFFPETRFRFAFSKKEYPGIPGAWHFGRNVRKQASFDLFFCLPDSMSSAIMGVATGSKKRIGFRKEGRSLLFTQSYKRSKAHRVEEYIQLLERFTGTQISPGALRLRYEPTSRQNGIVININSEATSRRLPLAKAVHLISGIRKAFADELVLIGGKQDAPYVGEVIHQLTDKSKIINMSGKTSLADLVPLMGSARMVLTTDSGPAHIANALGVHTVTLFGAGNEQNTAPYNPNYRSIIRLGQLPCEPCVKNTCELFGSPKCLELLDENLIISTMQAGYRHHNASVT
jgi:ADP-heptose:LPS heptosyltransferase